MAKCMLILVSLIATLSLILSITAFVRSNRTERFKSQGDVSCVDKCRAIYPNNHGGNLEMCVDKCPGLSCMDRCHVVHYNNHDWKLGPCITKCKESGLKIK